MQQLRIAMVCDIVPGQPGGSYISAVRFAERLRAKGHHVILVGSRDSKKLPVPEYHGIPVYQYFALPTPGTNRYYFQSFPRKSALIKLFREERINIVHVMFPSYSCKVAKKAARLLSVPVVAHIHTQPENITVFFPRFLRSAFTDRLVLRSLVKFVKDADRILCPSELGRRIYLEMDPSLPITILSNGIDLDRFKETVVETNVTGTMLGQKSPERKILFIGRLARDKDPETLIRAIPAILRELPNAHFDIVGTGPLLEEMQTLCKNLGVAPAITFHGKVSDDNLISLYRSCSFFVLPSHVELEGMVVLEAMACGAPILIANSPTSASTYFVKNNGFLFSPSNSEDLANKALLILKDDQLLSSMKIQSMLVAAEYDISRSVNELEEVYRSLV